MSFDSIDYDDLIIRHRQSSDIFWALKQWRHPVFDTREQSIKSKKLIEKTTQISSIITPVHYTTLPRTSEQIKNHVLNSLALKHTIEILNNEKINLEQAKIILDEMSHRLNMGTVRFLAFIFAKILNQVFDHIFIDRHGMEKICRLYSLTPTTSSPTTPSSPMTISTTLFAILNTFSRSSTSDSETILSTKFHPSPVTSQHFLTSPRIIYLPTHRSYMDFILLTYLCYEYNIPLPCIAAAQDFLGLGIFANLLRHCGAFFIRRSFRSDLLYWTLFDEYVKTHLVHGDFPLEFFIEGARSRTLKTLLPVRQGMLKSCLESYFRRQTENLLLIPITINYEKVLEENLHANELLGIPKPKESTSGLLKATQILKKSFGSMIVKFSEPIDVHDAFESFRMREEKNGKTRDLFDRSVPRGIEARFICQQDGLNPIEQKFLDELSYQVVNEQQRLTVIFPIAVTAFSLLHSSINSSPNRSIPMEQIIDDKITLFLQNTKVLEHFSTTYQLYWPSGNEPTQLKQRLLSLYSDIFEMSNDQNLKLKLTGDRLADTALFMRLMMYRNTCLHFFAKPAFVLLACQANFQSSIPYEQLRTYYYFFIHLFAYEFVYDRFPVNAISDDRFDQYLNYWIEQEYLIPLSNLAYQINRKYQQQISLITSPFEQYARAYLLIYEQENLSPEKNFAVLVKNYQKHLLEKLNANDLISILASSSNVISNALRTLNNSNRSLMLAELRHMLKKLFQPTSAHFRAKL